MDGLAEGAMGPRSEHACGDFTLNEAQVRAFFANARRVTMRDIHDDDDLGFAPCIVTGWFVWEGQRARFEINPFRVARLSLQDGNVLMLACQGECEQSVLGTEADRD
ncbi:MAG: hypothetical protein L0Y66_09630 [Myxococcaceae bacterium]|nr:hypothetical protein [Myxococcaceae bacterium]MCI0670950.1 hypothetical protein [Myxococcaceae bacterium]